MLSSNGNDIAQRGLITFPMRDLEGRVCGYRFKDPQKKLMAQQRRKGILNGVVFLGQHTLRGLKPGDRLAIVEGENDWLSMLEAGWKEGLLATCGQISDRQIEFLNRHNRKYEVITAFDNDHAGEAYRQLMSDRFVGEQLNQFVPDAKDPDAFLKMGGTIDELFAEVNQWPL